LTRRSETLNEGVSVINSTFPRLTLHPAAAGGWLPSGDSVDAGTMHHLSSNIQLLCRESARHLVADVGPGKLPNPNSPYTGNGKDQGYTDGGSQTVDDVDDVLFRIAWDRNTARSYHLANLIADRELPEGGYGLRVIEVEIDCYVDSANSLELFCALTGTYNTPDQGAIACATYSAWSADGEQFSGFVDGTSPPAKIPTGRQTIRMWLVAKTPAAAPWAQWRCRNSGSIASISSLVYEGHLWVGWRSSDTDNQILSINAWEVPDPFAPLIDTSVSSMLTYWNRTDTSGLFELNGTEYVETQYDNTNQYGYMIGNGVLNRSGVGGRASARYTRASGIENAYGPFGAAVPVPAEFTLFVVVTILSDNTTGIRPVFSGTESGGILQTLGIIGSGGQWGVWADDRTTGFIGTSLTSNKSYILCGRATTTDIFLDVNGIQVATAGRIASSGATFTGFESGYNAVRNGDGDFELSEALLYSAHLSTAERAFVLEYLNRRYGVF